LLAFFLNPNEAHGLGDLFLSTFLECMGEDSHHFKTIEIVQTQVPTNDGKFIDLLIRGPDCCLLIENKIRAKLTNPIASYKKHAKAAGKNTTLCSILSRNGLSKEDWKGVSYRAYCAALLKELPLIGSYHPISKWQLFAREFILHLENELDNPPTMKPEELDFVENHWNEIVAVQKLAQGYTYSVREELKQRLDASLSGFCFNARAVGWGFRCGTQRWGNSDVVLLYPHKVHKFALRAYLCDMSERQLSDARNKLSHMEIKDCGTYCFWDSLTGYDSRKEAIDALCELAQLVNDLLLK
jgi:hypothetical protein